MRPARIETVTSAANPLIKEVRRAIARGGLTDEGWCVAESFHLLEEALRSERDVPVVLVSEAVRITVERHVAGLQTTRRVVVPEVLFQTIASTETSQGVIALVRAAGVVDRSVVPRAEPGGGAGRSAGSGQRGGHRARGRGLRRHGRDVRERHALARIIRKRCGLRRDRCFAFPLCAGIEAPLARASLQQHRVDIYAAMPFTVRRRWRATWISAAAPS